ncbi:hypothetical protein Tco_0616690, partial [Tanacetum coccineum]
MANIYFRLPVNLLRSALLALLLKNIGNVVWSMEISSIHEVEPWLRKAFQER